MRLPAPFPGRLDAFLVRLADAPDPRLAAWTSPARAGDPRMALLAGCLGQDLSLAGAARLLRDLEVRLGASLLAPWTLRQESLADACRLDWLREWPHGNDLPGWIAAVGDLLREHPDPQAWHGIWGDPRDLVRTLALRIPWMGRKSTERVKAWRIARWLVRGEGLDAPLWPAEARRKLVVPHPVLAAPLGWFGLLPPSWDAWAPRRRQDWTDAILSDLRPDDPASAWLPLETILRRGRVDHRCAELLGGCPVCPLRPHCRAEPSRA